METTIIDRQRCSKKKYLLMGLLSDWTFTENGERLQNQHKNRILYDTETPFLAFNHKNTKIWIQKYVYAHISITELLKNNNKTYNQSKYPTTVNWIMVLGLICTIEYCLAMKKMYPCTETCM